MTDLTRTGGTDLRSLATEINREHEAAEKAINEALHHGRRCGDLLLEAKGQVGHGGWTLWLKRNFQGSARTAQRYMRIADRWEEIEANATRVTDLSIRGALSLLAEPRESEDDEPTDEPASHDTEPTDEPDAEPEPENQGEARNDDLPRDSGGGGSGSSIIPDSVPTAAELEQAAMDEKRGIQQSDTGAAEDEDDGKVVDLDEHRDTRTQKEWVDDEKEDAIQEVEESPFGRVLDFLGHVIEEPESFTDEEIREAVHDPSFPTHWMRTARHVHETLGRIIATAPEADEGDDHVSAR